MLSIKTLSGNIKNNICVFKYTLKKMDRSSKVYFEILPKLGCGEQIKAFDLENILFDAIDSDNKAYFGFHYCTLPAAEMLQHANYLCECLSEGNVERFLDGYDKSKKYYYFKVNDYGDYFVLQFHRNTNKWTVELTGRV